MSAGTELTGDRVELSDLAAGDAVYVPWADDFGDWHHRHWPDLARR